jgi:ABC-type transport system involved in cytochrome c biogenesis permease subunit
MSEQAPPAQALEQQPLSAWVPIGWMCAFVLPLVGFVIGFFLPRRHSQHGFRIMVVSLLVGVLMFALRS